MRLKLLWLHGSQRFWCNSQTTAKRSWHLTMRPMKLLLKWIVISMTSSRLHKTIGTSATRGSGKFRARSFKISCRLSKTNDTNMRKSWTKTWSNLKVRFRLMLLNCKDTSRLSCKPSTRNLRPKRPSVRNTTRICYKRLANSLII